VVGVKAIAEDIQIGVSPALKRTDAEIAETVLDALKWHTNVPHQNIMIKVEDGVVTLEGEVDWQYQIAAARSAIVALIGVRNVLNNIRVKPKIAAPEIKTRINEALQRAATVDADKITVDVNGTKVILYGKVRSHAEKEDAEEAVWCAPNVSSVESKLQVEPQMEFAF
jgi:osmotically-inducible protein OsmY